MVKIWTIAAIMLLLFALPAAGYSQNIPGAQLEATFISEVREVSPGQEVRVGVLFQFEKPWHIYWKNPGDAGLPTKLEIEAAGATLSDFAFPTPTEFTQPGGIKGFGYEDEALLRASLKVPADAAVGQTVTLSGKASYLLCSSKLCVPGRRDLSLEIPVSQQTVPVEDSPLKQWDERYPLDASEIDLQVESSGGFTSAEKNSGALNVTLRWSEKAPAERFRVFAAASDRSIIVRETSRLVSERGLDLEFELQRSAMTSRENQALELVVVPIEPTRGAQRAVEATVPLKS